MANFQPLKRSMLYCLDAFIERYGMHGPFLEIGCGTGDVSRHLAAKGWSGVAADFSAPAVALAREALLPFPAVTVRHDALDTLTGRYASILMWDVLEHIDDDRRALAQVAQLLEPGGHLLLAVPSNPREWRWDDDFYGHVRRYTVADLTAKLAAARLEPVVFWDFTYPVFWALRRLYTRLKSPPAIAADRDAATKASATVNAWDLALVSRALDRSAALWRPIQAVQFRLFRNATSRGHEFFALARLPLS